MSESEEVTFVMIKPDAVERKIAGEVITAIETAGFHILNMKMVYLTKKRLAEHYKEHAKKSFFTAMIEGMSNRNAIILLVRAKDAIEKMRELIGHTDVMQAKFNTIRGRFGRFGSPKYENVIHASDSRDAEIRETALWFY